MKLANKIMFLFLAALLAFAMFSGCTNQRQPRAQPATGGYTEDRKPDSDDLAVFETVIAGEEDVKYEPLFVATQVVAGTNYRFTVTATPDAQGEKPYTAYVYVFEPLSGAPELVEIVRADVTKQ